MYGGHTGTVSWVLSLFFQFTYFSEIWRNGNDDRRRLLEIYARKVLLGNIQIAHAAGGNGQCCRGMMPGDAVGIVEECRRRCVALDISYDVNIVWKYWNKHESLPGKTNDKKKRIEAHFKHLGLPAIMGTCHMYPQLPVSFTQQEIWPWLFGLVIIIG